MKILGPLKNFSQPMYLKVFGPPEQYFRNGLKSLDLYPEYVGPLIYVYILGFPGLIGTWYAFHFHHQPQYMHGNLNFIKVHD